MEAIYKYWGKARPEADAQDFCHLLPYHCLDVTAVADAWWQSSPVIQRLMLVHGDADPVEIHAWVLFFVALHDLGKFDIRFQLKSIPALLHLRPEFDLDSVEPEPYAHGPSGCGWLEHAVPLHSDDRYDCWQPWMQAVAGHHGDLSSPKIPADPDADEEVCRFDKEARRAWLQSLARLFLEPAGLSLLDDPPVCPQILAGFCSVADWVGSNADWFEYRDTVHPLQVYWETEAKKRALFALESTGILGKGPSQGGMSKIFPDYPPRQIQCLVDDLPREAGLLLVEGPTGCGKTEFGLAYAAHLLATGVAEAIIFALPTQATANAMLNRMEKVAPNLFPGQKNVVLAHGRASRHEGYMALKEAGRRPTAQGEEDAAVQCADWLAQSRKRVFLGQIGVCTIDQVLISVLAVRHHFVRAFGVRRAVLIVDEVHAYDAYMYGLLTRVLHAQATAGGSAILMSATLPAYQRDLLLDAWGGDVPEQQSSAYPLISWAGRGTPVRYWDLKGEPAHLPESRTVFLECRERVDLRLSDQDIDQVIQAANEGACVAVICNLVSEAQGLWRRLRERSLNVPVDLFHARYLFADRQVIEQRVMEYYGRDRMAAGRILVATQVVEQSLDLDFDWLITQLCPVDLLFQRMGRLHRHPRTDRPAGFEDPRCTVLLPPDEQYGLHEVIYRYRRVLWRTHRRLQETDRITFPDVYRPWIESVYSEEAWLDEPEAVVQNWETFQNSALGKFFGARQLAEADMMPLQDTDANAAAMTRDGDNGLKVLLLQSMPQGVAYLDGRQESALDDFDRREAEDLNAVNAPKGWKAALDDQDEQGRYRLILKPQADGSWSVGAMRYSREIGLEWREGDSSLPSQPQ
ncbi:hypothetical protein CKO35_03690 [Ectothiorhodospira shaposhnikovii]|uniref:CRISPR-associated helicase/endonuclease Cas3 n=1 Tax=Ectothiorhodospira shaposhnikovii TaxID=1054 RepID=UPI0019069141|nr:CRISPR-associated helicase/endonuclease Cas3 [Ectothiorhodospira shaposhnikovii]MBK1672410.1 hypothetical protein [Ectothiorhodospira shaposhnikovii]